MLNPTPMKHTSLLFVICCLFVTGQAQVTISEIGNLPEKVSNNAVCEGFIQDTTFVYSFGGIDTSKIYSGIHLRSFRYNTITGKAIQIPSLPDTLGKIAAGASRIGDIIYIAGGYHVFADESELTSNTLHRYDILNNVFLEDGANIPVATDDHVQAVWRDSLMYLITGWNNVANIPNVQIYDPGSDSWTAGIATPNNHFFKSFGASGTIVGDTIFYFGGAASNFGFDIQPYVRKGVINPANPMQISWSVSTPDPDIVGYRMASVFAEDSLYWIGGSATTYNFDGIAYNGTGGVPLTNRILSSALGQVNWIEQFKDEIPMDLRGIAHATEQIKYLAGGMLNNQQVTNKVYKLTFGEVGNTSLEPDVERQVFLSPNPLQDVLRVDNRLPSIELQVSSITGQTILQQQLPKGVHTISTEDWLPGIYVLSIQEEGYYELVKLIK